MKHPIEYILLKYSDQFNHVVPFAPGKDRLAAIDLSGKNAALTPAIFNDTTKFTAFIEEMLVANDARYGAGGYLENRQVYGRSPIFSAGNSRLENRTIHLGIDIWGPADTPVFAPLGGTVHSFAFNNHFGDYGATIILQHQLEGITFHTLYGHLSAADLAVGQNQYISIGQNFAKFGWPEENGNWPPHLHFQLIIDMELKEGDYPGVCAPSRLAYYRKNCPDPELVLNMQNKLFPAVDTSFFNAK